MPGSRLLILQHLLDRRPVQQPLIPFITLRVRALPIPVAQQPRNGSVPRHKHDINIGHLIADQVLRVSLGQVGVDDAEHTLHFVRVTVDRGGDIFLGMELNWVALASDYSWQRRHATNAPS